MNEIKNIDRVFVFKNNEYAGDLERTTQGARFIYKDLYKNQVAFNLPREKNEFIVIGNNLHPFFAGLLPEGVRLKILQSRLKTSTEDLFSLLIASGENLIGDISIKIELKETKIKNKFKTKNTKLNFYELFKESLNSDFDVLRNSDASVSGVVPKVSGAIISLKYNKKGVNYILKIGTDEHPKIVENEHCFMRLASICGFNTAQTEIIKDDDGNSGLLVKRFDRQKDQRFHQEDMCQILDRYPHDKYRLTIKELITEGLNRFASAPHIEILNLIKQYFFSYLIGNGDQHGKNFSLIEKNNITRLSPLYDVLSTIPYGDQSMALVLGFKDTNFKMRDFIEFGSLFNVPDKAIVNSLNEIKTKLVENIDLINEIGLPANKEKFLKESILARVHGLD